MSLEWMTLDYCATCEEDGIEDSRIKRHGTGWRHVGNNSRRCPQPPSLNVPAPTSVTPARWDS